MVADEKIVVPAPIKMPQPDYRTVQTNALEEKLENLQSLLEQKLVPEENKAKEAEKEEFVFNRIKNILLIPVSILIGQAHSTSFFDYYPAAPEVAEREDLWQNMYAEAQETARMLPARKYSPGCPAFR